MIYGYIAVNITSCSTINLMASVLLYKYNLFILNLYYMHISQPLIRPFPSNATPLSSLPQWPLPPNATPLSSLPQWPLPPKDIHLIRPLKQGYCSIRPLYQRHSFYRASFQIHWNSNIQVKIDTQKRSHPYYKATFSLQKGCPYKRKIIVLQMYVYSAVLLQYFKLLTTSNQHIQKSGIWYTSIIKEEFEDTKEVIRIHKSKKDRQHNG